MKKLEVESVSTTSIPMSIPYYFIAKDNDSFDTMHLLEGPATADPTPKYSNTSHLNSGVAGTNSPKKEINELRSSNFNKGSSPVVSKNDDEVFNQVPKRFSQFIIDQKNPFTVQRLDNLSADSSASDLKLKNPSPQKSGSKKKLRTSSEHSGPGRFSNKESIPHELHSMYHSNASSGEISNSMGSQATIFSTRQDLGTELQSNKIRQRPRQSRTRARLYSNGSDDFSTLSRRKAIRFKEGGWLYRLKIRINKMLTKLKLLRFKNFSATSKRTGSTSKKTKSRFFASKKRVSIRGKISNPNTNPYLGTARVVTVGTVDDDLKYLAGAPVESLNINKDGCVKASPDGKYNHLSSYIDQQQSTLSEITKNRLSSTNRGYEVVSSNRYSQAPSYAPGHDSLDPSSNIKHDETVISEASVESAAPPPPPPHLVRNSDFVPEIDQEYHEEQIIELWKSYLKHVLCKRIQIRQEINLFQSFVIEQERKNRLLQNNEQDGTERLVQSHESENVSPKAIVATNGNDEIESASDFSSYGSKTITDGTDHNSITDTISDTGSEVSNYRNMEVDSTVEKFNAKYQNRRSVLGEMLDYDSDDDSISSLEGRDQAGELAPKDSLSEISGSRLLSSNSSVKYSASFTSSMASDLGINKRYGTVMRKASKFSTTSAPSGSMSPMKRSTGIKTGLNGL